jgi:hypothetical protein
LIEGDQKLNGIVAAVYKSPKEKINDFIEILDDFVSEFCDPVRRLTIVGDINLNTLRMTKNIRKYYQLLNEYDLEQIVDAPTRMKGMSISTIDHVVTNKKDVVVEILKNSPTDHFMLQVKFRNPMRRKFSNEKVWIKSWRNYSASEANEIIDNSVWINFRCPSCDFANLESNLKLVLSKLVKNVCIKPSKVHFTNELFRLKQDIKLAYDKFTITHDNEDEKVYNSLMRSFKNELKKVKNNGIRNELVRNRRNSKKLWEILNRMYRQKVVLPNQIVHNDVLVEGNNDIAECLNNFFISSVNEIVNAIGSSWRNDYNDAIPRCNNILDFDVPVTMKEIKNIIFELKNKTYDDGINGKMLCDLVTNNNFMKCITNLANDCLRKSMLPNALKISIVTPKAKAKVLKEPQSFRPVNNLPVIEKIIERIVFNRLLMHVSDNNLLDESQFGFRRNHSTETAVLDVVYRIIRAFEGGKCLILLSLVFKRAFETVDRNGLCKKMNIYGCSERIVAWLQNYLANRTQAVKYNGVLSGSRPVTNGLPQGSKLSNLLFILFVNDLTKHLDGVTVTMFADDTLLMISCDRTEEGVKILNDNLVIVADWMKYNLMALNVEKCCATIINATCEAGCIGINFCNQPIKIVKSFKYLGITIDNELNLECHFETLLSKLNRNIGLLRRLASKMDFNSRKLFFKSVLLPSIDYCSSYLMLLDDVRIERIQKVVNKAMRCVLACDSLMPIDEMCSQIGVSKIKKRIQMNSLLLINKLIARGEPHRVKKRFILNCDARKRQLRNDLKFKLPLWKCAVSRRSIFYAGAKMYNEIEIDEKYSFKMNCRKFLNS